MLCRSKVALSTQAFDGDHRVIGTPVIADTFV